MSASPKPVSKATPSPQMYAAPVPASGIAPFAVWPIPGDVSDIQTIIQEQADTIAEQEVLLHAYQTNLNAVQNPSGGAAATGTGSASGTPANNLAVTNVGGTIQQGAIVTGAGVPAAPPSTTILGQVSGTTGGAGTYLTSQATSALASALTFTPPPAASTWPTPIDAPTLMSIQQTQTAILRVQSALLQHYQDLLNTSQTPAPPSGP